MSSAGSSHKLRAQDSFNGATSPDWGWPRGARQLTEIVEDIDDSAELAQVRCQARTVQIKAVRAATGLILGAILLPQPQQWNVRSGEARISPGSSAELGMSPTVTSVRTMVGCASQ